ncbi:class I SAM-dependent methyltransferase [Pseudoteredinibacter isoporae]|uniref:Ubiquinone/menaquinone biosynthesis C-methylase UbiE n=1 Tax=Pseudoteredinibacter isoporae TaxID=570281 RepID=A0A7X0MY83_9GAMM|nr:class I SAM-dependent methyltransferase [Pseudoteredinibacter isoporae]MBB6522799.1 ubiquinone/menaquinone biosynthesis C-methylase UbiE [Pseudoteredinibacter isoporae]NHO88326.1 class I SAM-dependent methyltransferase [Pseudoteredinibacter isoporae]NIB23343.1 class I SAM-dependent methyltransferase [Pseudoteredinibacter isoporae]
MSIYDRYLLPHLLDLACNTKPVRYQRRKVVPQAHGRVLEIGMGSGLNLPYYNADNVEMIWGLEPSEGMREKAQKNLAHSPLNVEWLDLPGEEIPLEDNSADSIVLTFTLCTIPGWQQALEQMRRVLKPGGDLLFAEHGRAPDHKVRARQDRYNPTWKKFAGGCNMNRPIVEMISDSGFQIKQLDSAYLPSTPKVLGFNYWGRAVIR